MTEGNESDKLDVKHLADSAHMSISAFHKAFKKITADSPLQYLKKIRLSKTRNFTVGRGMKVYLAADAVGYESPPKLSREFKRHFGQSPTGMMRRLP